MYIKTVLTTPDVAVAVVQNGQAGQEPHVSSLVFGLHIVIHMCTVRIILLVNGGTYK